MKRVQEISGLPHGVLFDVGGVLLHPDGELVSRTLEPLVGYRIDSRICQDSFLLTDYHLGNGALSESDRATIWAQNLRLPPQLALLAWKSVSQLDNELPNLWGEIDPCATSVLRELRGAGLKIGALSNARGNVEQLLISLGLAEYFDDVVDSFLVGLEKPDPRIYLLAAQRLGLQINKCAYIGDGVVEVEAARTLSMFPILYDRLGLQEMADSFYKLQSLCQLSELLGVGS